MHKSSKIFIAFLVVAAATFTYSLYVGKNQKQVRKEDYIKYTSATTIITEGGDSQEALEILDLLSKKYGDTTDLLLNKALANLRLGEFAKVKENLEVLIELDKEQETNSGIMLLYAEASIESDDIEEAKNILDKVSQLNLDEKDQEKLQELMKKVG